MLVTYRGLTARTSTGLRPQKLGEVVAWVDEFAAFFGQRRDDLGAYLDKKHGKRR